MKIENGKIVKLALVNQIPPSGVWGTFELEGRYPDDFSHKGLKETLLGMEENEYRTLSQDVGGGLAYTQELVFNLPKYNFKGMKEIKKGMVFKTKFQKKVFTGIVSSVDDEFITLDCNYPLKENLNLKMGVGVQSVRDPTKAEIESGFEPSVIML